jgi:hypothetical protein
MKRLSRWFRLNLLIVVLFASTGQAQSTPHLDGRVETDSAAGLLHGNICLSKLPKQPAVPFLLNRSLNIRELKDVASGRSLKYWGYYDAVGIDDATRYSRCSIGTDGFCVDYVGAFSVYRVDNGEHSEIDWKGQIAFDGRTVRVAE